LFKVFNLGIVLGIAAAAALTHFAPVVDLHRETSMIVVQANRANTEAFQISLPRDRIVAGVPGLRDTTPPGLAWPEFEFLADMQTEIFKVRNDDGIVIGIASRMSGTTEALGSFVEWTIHLPARGTMFVTMAPRLSADGYREGSLRAGTREFLTLHGSIVERFVRDTGESDSDISGRIELIASLVGPAEAVE
jgi:hypothetical protein